MERFKVVFYREEDGSKPLGAFIRSLRNDMKAALVMDLHLLEEFGNMAREPLSKHLCDGIFELRTTVGSDIIRVLFFYDKDRIIVATNGFVKKSQKTPHFEIELAKKRRNIYYGRKESRQ